MKNEHQLRDFFHRVQYEIKRRFWSVIPSATVGMGAVSGEEGTTFRVWAPHADKLFVVGTFNDWSPWRSPLAREADGSWSTDIPQAKAGDEYKFLIHHKSQRVARTDPYAAEVTAPFNNGRIQPPPATSDEPPFAVPALPELIIYELHIGTFAANGSVGTFTSAIKKLPYLQTLGINAIELMPVKQFPGDYSWGYNPSHPFAIAPSYGGRTALKELIQAAHAYGIAVIVDVVYNHFGPQELSLWQFDGWHQDNQGGIYFYNDWRSQTPWAHTRPDYGRAQVRQYISDNVRMWLDEFQVDGLRWDATSYNRTVHGHDGEPNVNLPEGWQLMQAINAEMQSHYPEKISIAED
jgi:1,4-alpha-glucan branching enzyme